MTTYSANQHDTTSGAVTMRFPNPVITQDQRKHFFCRKTLSCSGFCLIVVIVSITAIMALIPVFILPVLMLLLVALRCCLASIHISKLQLHGPIMPL